MRCAEKVAAAYLLGHRDAIEAARDAVAASTHCCNCTAPTTTSGEHDDWCMVFNVLAAIDALRKP